MNTAYGTYGDAFKHNIVDFAVESDPWCVILFDIRNDREYSDLNLLGTHPGLSDLKRPGYSPPGPAAKSKHASAPRVFHGSRVRRPVLRFVEHH